MIWVQEGVRLLNKWFKTNALKSYNYAGMIVVSLFSSNVQYLSFRCFAQLYQIVPASAEYYVNLLACYFILFIIIIYSTNGIKIFKMMYWRVNEGYIEDELFGGDYENTHIHDAILQAVDQYPIS